MRATNLSVPSWQRPTEHFWRKIETGSRAATTLATPEFELARWAAQYLTPDERSTATVFTSGEHCAMCSAAHAWVGLGRIVYICSSAQLGDWLAEWGVAPSPVKSLSVNEVAPNVPVEGPVPELVPLVRELHRKLHSQSA